MKEIAKILSKHGRDRGIAHHEELNNWLDFILDMFDFHKFGIEHFRNKANEDRDLYVATIRWLNVVADRMEKGGWVDVFGELYEEMYQTKSKSSKLGQFFTPPSVCDVMAKIVDEDKDKYVVNDPSCGSGRTLLAHFMCNKNINRYYIGEDIDVVSVKMCALNMMAHGMVGRVVQHDTLRSPIEFNFGYEINEIRYPFMNIFYSVRKITGNNESFL